MRSAERYEILYDLPEGEYDRAAVGGIRTRTIRAGDTLEVECFPVVRIGGEARRERARRESSPAQARLNERKAADRLRRLAEANFTSEDYALSLTNDYGFDDYSTLSPEEQWAEAEARGVPTDEEGARRQIRNYLARVRRRLRRLGGDAGALKYLYVMESGRDRRDADPRPRPVRFHFHVLIHAPGLSRDQLEALWGFGYADCDRLDLSRNGLAALSRYLTKQRKFTRRWAHSKNLREPDVRVSDRAVSRRRAERVARDVRAFGREIFEKIYPGYRLTEEPRVLFSDFVAGAYIFARLRRGCSGPPPRAPGGLRG